MRNIGGRITPGLLEQLGLLGRIGQVAGERPRRLTASFIGRGNSIRRPGAAHVSRRQAGRPVVHCNRHPKTTRAESTSCDMFPERFLEAAGSLASSCFNTPIAASRVWLATRRC